MARKSKNKKENADFSYPTKDSSTKLLIAVTAKNVGQKKALKAISENKVTFIYGASGSGKTHCAVGWGIQELIKGNFDRVIFTRPYVEAGEKLGYLPGNSGDKFAPFTMPLYEVVSDYLSADDMKELMDEKKLMVYPLAYMRGAAQPLDAKILTPHGFVKMEQINVGDLVIGVDGKPTEVTGVFPQGQKEVFRIKFSDGSSTECCDDHWWMTKTLSEKRHNKDFSLRKTSEIRNYIKTKANQKNHEIPVIQNPVEFEYQYVELDPYLLGLLLGDGCLHAISSVKFTTADDELVSAVATSLPHGMSIKYASNYDYRLVWEEWSRKTNPLKNMLSEFELLGTQSHTKFVPNLYKFNSSEIRLAVLQGLMDSDGSVFLHRSGKSRVQYYSTSKQLADDVVFLVQSLGGIAYTRLKKVNKDIKEFTKGRFAHSNFDVWIVDIVMSVNPFRLSRKANMFNPCRVKRLIDSIEKIGFKECQCISVASDKHLYVTDDFIVTHNTFKKSYVIADEVQNTSPQQMRMLLTRVGEGSKIVCTGDVEQSDIGSKLNGLADAINRLQDIQDLSFVELDYASCVRDKIVADIDQRYKDGAFVRSYKTKDVTENVIKANNVVDAPRAEEYD